MKNTGKYIAWTLLAASVFLLSGCADKVTFEQAATHQVVGFWYGFWHGMIAGWSFIISLFDSDYTIYAIYNNGAWYNFGFIWGVGAITSVSRSVISSLSK